MGPGVVISAAALMLIAWILEIIFGWPDWLYRRIGHPVSWLGHLINALQRCLNNGREMRRYAAGLFTTVATVGAATAIFWLIARFLPPTPLGILCEAAIASTLIASRSLYQHVADVAKSLEQADLGSARKAVSMVVGRDTQKLDDAGIARASLESLAENSSDGIVAPLFWGALLGLPGLAAYKAINTLDSMIGHKTDRFQAFGGFAARLDDLVNLIPARLTGFCFIVAAVKPSASIVMWRDAWHHRSPNAGWPEAAMAGALDIRLAGPRIYDGASTDDPWLNEAAPDPQARDVKLGLTLYCRMLAIWAVLLAGAAWVGTSL